MVKKATRANTIQSALEIIGSREDVKLKLERQIEKGRAIFNLVTNDPVTFDELDKQFNIWDAFNTELLRQIFTNEDIADEYSGWLPGAFDLRGMSLGEKISKKKRDITEKNNRIESIIERLEIIPTQQKSVIPANTQLGHSQTLKSTKVFIVHGHDEIAKTSLETFLYENKLEPVVLHRQADEGQTIIEKFEKHSDVGYAFILLTPDEISYLASEESKNDSERKKEYRARPNVIFEFGYFVGKLGRSKVCCLYTGNVAIPSDISGLTYKKYANSIEEIGYSIIKDLRAAGYSL